MSNFLQAATLLVIGGALGVGGITFATHSPAEVEAAAAELPPVVRHAEVEPQRLEIEKAVADSELVTAKFVGTGGVESAKPRAAFGIFEVRAGADVGSAELYVSGRPGVKIVEAVGSTWHREGASVRIDVGDLSADEVREVVVEFELTQDTAQFDAHTGYRDLHTTSKLGVTGESKTHSLTRKVTDPDAYARVRKAFSNQALEEAHTLREDGNLKDALTWVEQARVANLEVGRTLRMTASLAGPQTELTRVRDELEIALKPKPKAPRRAPRKIDFVRVVN